MYESTEPLIRIEASQKGWLLIQALSLLVSAVACIEAGEVDWDAYVTAKGQVLLALKGYERWHGRE